MDRIIHSAYRLELKGESMRKRRSLLTQFRPEQSIMIIQHRFAPIGDRFKSESVAGLTGIYIARHNGTNEKGSDYSSGES
jgi:hypothetical protein